MILQSTDELEKLIGNKYSLVIVSAKRARQLKEGHPSLVHESSPNALSIALQEIQDSHVVSIAPPEEDLAPAPRDVITSLVTGADFDLDEDLDLDEGDAVDDLAALLVGAGEETDEDEETDSEPDLLPTAGGDDEEEEEETTLDTADDTDDAEE